MRTLADIAPQQYYRHHQGEYYCVRAIARSAESGEPIVVYSKAIYPEAVWYHTPEQFLKVLPDGRERFALCDVLDVLKDVDPRVLEKIYFVSANELGEKGRR
jgi:hypothetical protein